MTPAQVLALGVVAASIAWGAWMLRDRPSSEEVELLPGTVLPSSELAIVEAAFDRAQLSGHRTEDGRVWVPRARQSGYMRALVDAEALPREFGSSLRRALENASPWQSRAAQEELLRVAVQEELAHVICSMPGIERAAVLYDVRERTAFDGGLGGAPARTASVNVRTQPDAELEPARVQAIRVLVAASIAGLDPERVAVTDLRSGRVHSGPLEVAERTEDPPPSAADPALARQIAHERHLAAKVRQGLAFIRGAVVDVTVAVSAPVAVVEPALPRRQQQVAGANAPAEVEVSDAAPRSVDRPDPGPVRDGGIESIVVAVAVPETWFETALRSARQRDPAATAADVDRREEDRIRGHVLELLPTVGPPDGRRVVVTRFPVAMSRPVPPPRTSTTAVGPQEAALPAGGVPPQSPAGPRTLGDYVDATVAAVSAGRLGDVPREAWMVLVAKCSAIMAYLLLRAGSRPGQRPGEPGHEPPVRQGPAGRREWSGLAAGGDDDRSEPPRRLAA